jgi:hypothetical protein
MTDTGSTPRPDRLDRTVAGDPTSLLKMLAGMMVLDNPPALMALSLELSLERNTRGPSRQSEGQRLQDRVIGVHSGLAKAGRSADLGSTLAPPDNAIMQALTPF